MPTNSVGRFNEIITSNQLEKGLSGNLYTSRNEDQLIQSDYAVGYQGSLSTVPNLSQRQLDLSNLNAVWPFPQLFNCNRVTLICTQDTVAMSLNPGETFNIMWTGGTVTVPWSCFDFIDFIILSNSEVCLQWDWETRVFKQSDVCPPFRTGVNYNQQLVLGAVLLKGEKRNGIKG